MRGSFLVFLFLFSLNPGYAQSDIHGEWVGILIQGRDQFHFELDIVEASENDPVILNGHSCKKIKGSVIDYRDSTKLINFYGIINPDKSMNMMDSKLVKKIDFSDELRSHYQFQIEFRNGEPWMIGYWQDYNNEGWKQAQGRLFLKRKPPPGQKA